MVLIATAGLAAASAFVAYTGAADRWATGLEDRPPASWGDGGTGGITDLRADGTSIEVLVTREGDVHAYALEDDLTVEAFDPSGALVFRAAGTAALPSGDNAYAFSFTWDPEPGVYIVRATLGPRDASPGIVEITVLV